MIKRVIEVNSAAKLTVKNRQLVITEDNVIKSTAPIEDLGILVLDNPAITCSVGLITRCLENNVALLTCDSKHLPSGIFLPLSGNSLQTKTMANQLKLKQPLKKRLWQAIIKAKIYQQAVVLKRISRDTERLLALVPKVKSGDTSNVEAEAARVYWKNIFSPTFKRDKFGSGINSLLNYGYAIIRALVARAVVSSGLHPSIGLHHHNQYDNFCLVDDLVEPLRPAVDLHVYQLSQRIGFIDSLTSDIKKELLQILNHTFIIKNQKFPLFVAVHHYAASFRKIIQGETKKLEIPLL